MMETAKACVRRARFRRMENGIRMPKLIGNDAAGYCSALTGHSPPVSGTVRRVAHRHEQDFAQDGGGECGRDAGGVVVGGEFHDVGAHNVEASERPYEPDELWEENPPRLGCAGSGHGGGIEHVEVDGEVYFSSREDARAEFGERIERTAQRAPVIAGMIAEYGPFLGCAGSDADRRGVFASDKASDEIHDRGVAFPDAEVMLPQVRVGIELDYEKVFAESLVQHTDHRPRDQVLAAEGDHCLGCETGILLADHVEAGGSVAVGHLHIAGVMHRKPGNVEAGPGGVILHAECRRAYGLGTERAPGRFDTVPSQGMPMIATSALSSGTSGRKKMPDEDMTLHKKNCVSQRTQRG